MTAGGRCSFLRAACCERIVKWCKLTIKEGDQGNERKTKVICKHRLSGVASVSEWVRRESWDERNEKGRGGEGRKENCFLFTVWTGGPKGRDHNFFGKFSHPNIVLYQEPINMMGSCLYAAPAVNNFLVSPSSCKHIYLCLCTIYFSVFSLCKQLISKFSNPPPPTSSKKLWSVPKSVPWVPRTFLARFPVSVKQGG